MKSNNRDKCRTPKCDNKKGHGRKGRFCEICAQNLARIADVLKAESMAMHKGGLTPGRKKKFTRRFPRCCRKGCDNRRIPPATFCGECIADGYTPSPD